MTNKEFAQDTKNLVNDLYKNKDTIENNFLNSQYFNKDEIFIRMLINRLYYALYNRLIYEFPDIQLDEYGAKHKRLLKALEEYQFSSMTAKIAANVLNDLRELRIWADYFPNQPPPTFNLNNLLWKVQNIINYKKII